MTKLDSLVERAFDESASNPIAQTHALLVLRQGVPVVERYAPGFDAESTFISWSIAKSICSALCGILVDRGLIDIDAPAAIPQWHNAEDPRAQITLRHLLEMRSGLQWSEDYVDRGSSDVIDMLFGPGKQDMAAFAAEKPLEHEPGTHFLYSSGTTNIIARILGDVLGSSSAVNDCLKRDLFEPAAMSSATPKFDAAGTFVASSFVYATARDFARFGELFRNQGQVGGVQVLSPDWVCESLIERSVDEETGQGYGLQWWLVDDGHGTFACSGFEGQRIQVSPELDLTFVRLGKTDAAYTPDLADFYAELVDQFA